VKIQDKMDSIYLHKPKPVSTAQKQLSVMSFTNSTTFKKITCSETQEPLHSITEQGMITVSLDQEPVLEF
jgi:hypothetical protein